MLLSVDESVEVVVGSRREVGCQWESPEDQCKEVGVQSSAEHIDVAVQVDLIGLSCRTEGSGDVPWHCFTVREDEPGGGALWQHCSSHNNATMTISPPALSSVLLSSSPTRTPQKDTQHSEHSTPHSKSNLSEHTTPSMHQSELSLPIMPLCGESPSATLNESPEIMGFLAPLSSDEEDLCEEQQDQHFDEDRPPIKRRRGRGRPRLLRKDKNSKIQNSTNYVGQSSSDTVTSTKKRRRKIQTFETKANDEQRPKRKTAGLPVRYLQDYDMETHGLLLTNQEKERTETEKCKTKLMEYQEKSMGENGQKAKPPTERVLFLPYYKQSLTVEQPLDYQKLTKRLNEQEDRRQTNSPIITHPGFDHSKETRNIIEDIEPHIVPLKLKKCKRAKGTNKSKNISSKKIDWQISDNLEVKEGGMEEDIESDVKLKIKTIKQEEGIDETQSLPPSNLSSGQTEIKPKVCAYKRTTDVTKFKRILIKQDGDVSQLAKKLEETRQADCLKTSKPVFTVTQIDRVENVEELDIIKLKVDDLLIQANAENEESKDQLQHSIKHRDRGRPRKNGKIKQKYSEVEKKLEKPVLTEQPDRPRRSAVGPPVRYLLQSEEEVVVERPTQLSPEGAKRRGRPRKTQTETIEVDNTSDSLQWLPEVLANKEVAVRNDEVGQEDANSVDSQMTGSYEDREGLLAGQEGANIGNGMMTNLDGVVCKMFVQGQDGNWTEQEAQTLKLKDMTSEPAISQDGNCGKIYSSLETVTMVNHEVETAKGDAEMSEEDMTQEQSEPEILVFKVQDDVQWMDMEAASQIQNASEVSTVEDDNCEIIYEYEDIENFHYVVQKEKEIYKGGSSVQSGKTVGGSRIQWANQNADNTKYIMQDNGDEWKRSNDGKDGCSKKKRQSIFDNFLVHQEEDTGKTTLIAPCFVRLQPMIKPFL